MKDKLIRSRSRAATPIGCVRPNICIRVIGLLGLEVSTKPGAIQYHRRENRVLRGDHCKPSNNIVNHDMPLSTTALLNPSLNLVNAA